MANEIYNLDQLDELAGGDQDFVQSMIETFLEHTPQQLQEILDAREKGDLATIGSVSHKIKPNVDLFGLEDIQQTIRDMEQMGKEGQGGEKMDSAIEKVRETLNIAFDQLKNR